MSSLVVLLCLTSLHACSAIKEVEKEKFQKTWIPPSASSPCLLEKMQKQEKLNGKEIHKSWDDAKYRKHIETKAPQKAQQDEKGNEMIPSSSRESLRMAPKTEEWKRQSRRMLRPTTSHRDDFKETMDSKEDAALEEDIVVMDYAQPHKKPPIHN
ncbi:uncharacterized protein LOC127787276 isoform X2 [Diospyros lotus]|uniref:uncharacterized protein LOC127787276 isoform X2 n=1 Tax=Diospyros lotus TaxID=55363 RepID=UPI002255AD40|nr:uncharacterized protein LOC127787276 isoform X2 [Diospyros lotus]